MFSSELWNKPAGGGGANFYTHQIANSIRMPAPSSTASSNSKLKRTVGTPDSNVHFTLNFWIKRSAIGGTNPVGGVRPLVFFTPISGTSGSTLMEFKFSSPTSGGGVGDSLMIVNTSSNAIVLSTDNVYRDTSAWYNIHIQADADNGTNSEKLKIFVNGTETNYNTDNRSSFTSFPGIAAGRWTIGDYYDGSYPIQSYFAQFCYIDGTTYAASDFGETKNGVWIPKDPSGLTFGSEGYYLDFAASGDLGNDVSGNNNDWELENLSAHDQMLDSPTFNSDSNANFPTINVLDPTITVSAISEGNLKITEGNGLGGKATFAVPLTGKWYWEAYVNNGANQEMWAGITGITTNSSGEGRGGSSNSNTYGASWSNYSGSNMYIRKYIAGTESAESGSFGPTSDTILGIAVNRDDNEAKFYKNNALQFTTAISATQEYFPAGGMGGGNDSATIQVWNFGQDGTFAGNETAQGNADGNGYGDFYYAPPTDFLALCSGNISAAGADPAEEKQPVNNYFQAVTYTGTGANGRSLTTKLKAANFIGKNRTTGASTPTRWLATTGNNFGTGTEIYVQLDTDSYGYSSSTYQGVSNPQDTSITIGNVGYINVGSSSYVAYLHGVAGASAVTDTSGDINSVRFTDADAGISIMDYTGSGTNGHTVPHGLGVKPSFAIIKNSTITGNSSAWRVWSDAFGDYNDYAVLNTGAAWTTSGGPFTADPTTTMLPLASGDTQNSSSNTYIAWVFANTEGMVKAGEYTGNGNADGTFVYTGFKPAWVMVKNITGESWVIADNATNPNNVVSSILKANNHNPEATGSTYYCDFLSNGFKPRTAWEGWNQNSTRFIYLAFAEMPFKYATAR